MAALSDRLSVEVLNPYIDRERPRPTGWSVTPAMVVEGARDYGIRFLGLPGGYEFANLIDSIIAVSTGAADLSDETKAALAALDRRRHDQGLHHAHLTPLSPGRAPGTAHGGGVASGSAPSASRRHEFPEMSQQYRVMAVPKIVINDRVEFEGALPEREFLSAVLRAVEPRSAEAVSGSAWNRGAGRGLGGR